MKNKIVGIFVCIMLVLTAVVFIPDNMNVEATPGSGGEEDDGKSLNNSYIWDQTISFANVIYDAYGEGEIPKGESFGSKGGNYTINNILLLQMENEIDLEDVHTEQIKHIPGIEKNYTTIIDVNDFQLTVNNNNYLFPNPIPVQESFVFPSGYPDKLIDGSLTHNYSLNNVEIRPQLITAPWPLGGTLNNYTLNITSFTILNNDSEFIIGNLTYIAYNDTVPDYNEQLGRVFIIDETEECSDKLENLTIATGCILIDQGTKGVSNITAEKCSFPVVRIDESDGNNIKELMENYSTILVDNITGNLTLTYNLNEGCFPDSDFVLLFRIPTHNEFTYDIWSLFCYGKAIAWWWINRVNEPLGMSVCRGIVLYDSFEHHHMGPTTVYWDKTKDWNYITKPKPALPMFTLNYTVGSFLYDNYSCTTLTGYCNQEFLEETNDSVGVEAYNVIGNITIDNSPSDAIAILSNRYDGWWGQTPGDSGVGGAIVLGIAKYMKEYNIEPKYNLTFLFTTGEEYGLRGAHYYSDNHLDDNIKFWFGLDQLAFDQSDTVQEVGCGNISEFDIVWTIINQTQYVERTGYALVKPTVGSIGGTEQEVFNARPNCNAFCIAKDRYLKWDRWHKTGMNYTEGDSLKYTDRNDVNVTAELAWNITKYFTVWPDCWFDSGSAITVDTDDNDDLDDTIIVSFYSKSILPHDLAMVNFTLSKEVSNEIIMSKYMNFSINRNSTLQSLNITLPENEKPGLYTYSLKLYNSTGRINNNVGIGDNNINDTESSGFFFLYPYGSNITVPIITNVSANPDPVGFGFDVTINADVISEVSTIDTVTVNISYPDDTYASFNMTDTIGDTYEYVFTDTWQKGVYDFVIWAKDINGNESGSSQHTFNVSAEATISVCTFKDSYGNNETVNLTDPPSSSYVVGYELLNDSDVLHIWNNLDHYYFDTDSGIQLTNHYNEYWSHNVLMLGYYNNDEWNLIYRTDELSGFNKEIESDNEIYVNATLWKNLNYGGYDFRLAIRYHLGINDNELTVIPYIKNIDNEDIPYNLGFAWEIKDIQIDMTEENDYIEIDGTTYYLNEEDLVETYTNLEIPSFYIREDTGVDESESLYLRWDKNLNYKVQVKSRDGQYNAPVTLGIKIGTLSVGQEKSTELFWHDATEVIYYFNDYDPMIAWATNPANMADGNTSNYASTTVDRDLEKLDIILDSSADKGAISKVEIRAFGKRSGGGMMPPAIILNTLGGLDVYTPTATGNWSSWYDITNKPNAPDPWTWTDVDNLIVEVEASVQPAYTLYCSKVDVRVTYNPNPVISNPYPSSGSKGITLSPVLNITVSDPNGGTMNITWLSNSSGSWQIFGRNNSVSNGTYHQTFSNASVNGQWWYWKVNVSDGTNTVTSNVFSFYTGYQSKIENTGSTNFTGYLLMQIEFYNTTNSSWILEQVVVNESTPRTINAGCTLALDTIFNPNNVSTSSFTNGNGSYRVYAAFRDPDGDVLVCDDETLLEDSYQFTVT